jgi:hypothetical protein
MNDENEEEEEEDEESALKVENNEEAAEDEHDVVGSESLAERALGNIPSPTVSVDTLLRSLSPELAATQDDSQTNLRDEDSSGKDERTMVRRAERRRQLLEEGIYIFNNY